MRQEEPTGIATLPSDYSFTDDDIRRYGIDKGWVNEQGLVVGNTDAERATNARNIYNDAKAWGVSSGQLESAFGWDPGVVDSYMASLKAGGGGYSVAGELSELLQTTPAYRNILDQYAPQYEGRNGIYGAIGSFGATQDPAVMSQKFPTKEAAQAAAQQLMAGVTPAQFSEGVVQGAPQYMSQFKDSSESDDFFGMHTDTLVRGILGVIGGGVASGLGAGAAGSGAAAGGFSSAAMGGDVQDVLRSTATGAAAGYLGGQIGDYISGAGGIDPYGPNSGWGQDTLSNMGYSPAEIAAMQAAPATVGDAGGINWGESAADAGGIGSLTDGVDANAFDLGYNTGDISYGSLTDGVDANAFDAGYNTGDIDYSGGVYSPGSGWGQDTLTNMGYTPEEITAMQQYQGGYDEFGSGYNPSQDHLTPAAIDSMTNSPGYGSNAAAEALSGQESGIGALDPDFRPEYITAPSDYVRDNVLVTDTRIPPADSGTLPLPGGIVPNIPTGATPPVTNPTLPDVPKPVDTPVAQKSDIEKFWDWAKANPALAMQLFGLGASAFGGKGGSNSPAPGTGPQAGMTTTPAAPLNRQYVAPPAGYRPGFDPEWTYFRQGPAPTGTSSIIDPNAQVFTPGMDVGG